MKKTIMNKETTAALFNAITNTAFTLRAIKDLRVCDKAHGTEIDPTELDYAEFKARTLLEVLYEMRGQEAAKKEIEKVNNITLEEIEKILREDDDRRNNY